MDCDPLIDLAPDHAPEAVQAVAFVADQFRVALPPRVIALGPTLKVTVGVGDLMETLADWAAVPPAPVQVKVYLALAVSDPVDCEPLTGLAPDQPPEAEQDVALCCIPRQHRTRPRCDGAGAA